MTGARIQLFDVRAQEDGPFLTAWDGSGRVGRLHRALLRDVAPRFLAIEAADRGDYAVVHEEGDPDGAGGVRTVDLLAVAEGDDERFVAAWLRLQEVLAGQRGRLGARLFRCRGPADFRFVALARWSSPLMVARARSLDEVRDAAAALEVRPHSALYEVVRE